MAGKRAETLVEVMLFIEMFTLHRTWNGLTDDELMWEPTEGRLTVRRVTESRTANRSSQAHWRQTSTLT
jgi:hypothetical protein